MTLYLDSSALVKLYVFEEFSAEVIALAQRDDVFFVRNGLHTIEVRNAIRLLLHRGAIDIDQHMRALSQFDIDLADGRYERESIDFSQLTNAAEALSALGTAHIGSRSIDILHVAAAKLGASDGFVSFDKRQRELAALAGLKLVEPQL